MVGLRHARRHADIFCGGRRGTDKHEHFRLEPSVIGLLFEPVRRTAQGQFAQGRQIIRAEKVFQREGGAVFFINLSLLVSY